MKKSLSFFITLIFCISFFTLNAQNWNEIIKATASDATAIDIFGYSVSIDGDYAIVGSIQDDDNGSNSGSAYVFMRSGSNWIEQAKLTASDGTNNDLFGFYVSIDGDYAIVSSIQDDDNGSASGSAYVFMRSGSNWIEQAKLIASDADAGDQFGRSVSIDGNYAIVGAHQNDDNGSASGSAYVFMRSGSSWIEQAKLTASDAAEGDQFGYSVSIADDYAIVGAYLDDDNGSASGSAYMFMRSGSSWIEQAKLTASDGAGNDQFGFSAAIDGDYALVGAYFDDDDGSNSGSAYVFMRSGSSWTQQAKLTASDADAGDQFGRSVSIANDNAFVGAFGNDDNGSASGSAYAFMRSGSSWTENTKQTASDADAGDQFGGSVSIAGDYAIVGANQNDDNGNSSGSVYFYEYDAITTDLANLPDVTAQCEASPTAPTANSGAISATADLTFPITIQGTTIVTWTYDDGFGNTETQTQNIIIDDTTGPNLSFANPSDATVESCSTELIVASPLVIEDCLTNDFALDFDGVDDMVTVNQTIGSFKTIEFWMYTENGINGSEEFDYLFSFNDSNLKYIGTGNFSASYTNETLSMVTNFGQIMTTFEVIPPGWNHIAITGNGSSFDQVVINGDSKPVVNNGFPAVFEASTTYIGQNPATAASRFEGQLDEIRFWNTPRTEQDIADNFEKLIDASSPNLLAYYDFEDGPGSSILTDKNGNGAQGDLNNMDVNSDWVSSTAPVESVTLINDFNGTSDASGTYPEGQTTVTWTATDANGNTNTLQQIINAGDTEGPEISFANPSDSSITSCDTNVTITTPLVSDNCSINTALSFDGINDRVIIPSSSSLQFTTEMTIQAWIYPEKTSYSRIVSNFFGGGITTVNEIVFDTYNVSANNGRGLRFVAIQPSNLEVSVPNVLTLNTWNHVSVTFNSGLIKLYVDGNLVHSDTIGLTSLEISGTNFAIGEDRIVNTPNSIEFFEGGMDEIRIWNKALESTEIANTYDQLLTGTEPGLIAYYDFEDGTGSSVLIDKSSSGNDGALTNMNQNTDWVTSTAPITMASVTNDFNGVSNASGTYPDGQTIVTWTAKDASGNTNTLQQTITTGDTEGPQITCSQDISQSADLGECSANIVVPQPVVTDNCINSFSLDFDGTDDYVDLNGSITIPNTFTVESWIYPTSVSGENNILSECDDPNTSSACLGTDYKGFFFRLIDGKLSLAISPNDFSVRGFAYQTNNSVPLNTWTHVAAVVNTSTNAITMYFNGIPQTGSLTFLTGSGGFSATYNPHIGAQQNTFNDVATLLFSGKLDELRIWDSQLTQTEIQDQSEMTLLGNEPGLIAYYDFEDGPDSMTLTGATGSGVDGSLTNMDASTDWQQGPDVFNELALTNDFNGTSDASGVYPVGETEIVWTVTDASNNSSTCTQLVTVTSTECGTIYTYNNGVWLPSNPNGVATADDDIIIQTGDATFSSSTTADSVTVEAGASLTVNASTTLTVTNGLLLESNSTSYSSLILEGTVAGTMTYERHININGSGTTGSNDLVSAPLTGQDFATFSAANPNIFNNGNLYLFGPLEKVTGQYVNWTGTETATLDPSVGYRAATSDNSVVTFTGTANNSTITNNIINAGTNNEEWNLVGNPYPSYLSVQDFLSQDVGGVTNIQLFDAPTAAIYGYDGTAQNGWKVYNLANTTASTIMAPGQGFFVSADATNAPLYDLQFTPSMRRTGSGDDFISGRNAELIYVKLNASTVTNSFNTEFYFNANATASFDLGYDAAVWNLTPSDFAIYSHLVENNAGNAIALQTLNLTDLTEVSIPLGVNANQGEQLTFSIADMILPDSVKVYLDDVVANTTTLLNNSDYSITPITNLSGTGRFFLRTSNDTLSMIENSLNTLNIFALNSSKVLVITGQLKDDTILNLYDIQGRKIFTTKLDKAKLENRIDVSNLSVGVYVVNVQNAMTQKSQKVIIK